MCRTQVRLRIGIALVGAGAVRNHRLVEALLKLAAQAVDAPLGFFRKLLLRGAILDGAHILAHLEFEVLQQRCQLGFKFARAVAQIPCRPRAPVCVRSWFSAYCCSRAALRSVFKLRQFVVQLVEETRDIDLLRAEPLTRGGNDVAIRARAARRSGCPQTRRERRGEAGSSAPASLRPRLPPHSARPACSRRRP